MSQLLTKSYANMIRSPMLSEEQVDKWFEFASTASRKGYSHFDSKHVSFESNISKSKLSQQDKSLTVKEWIMIPANIANHSFLPFINFKLKFERVSKLKEGETIDPAKGERSLGGKLKVKIKERSICYASHFDRFIYQYYSFQLNSFYTSWMLAHNINDVAIAYRPNSGKSNIEYAKIAFDKIRDLQHCFIVVSDFKSFFETLDWGYLKQCMCEVLGVERLADDWFAVFKSVSNYDWVKLEDIARLLKFRDSLPSSTLDSLVGHTKTTGASSQNESGQGDQPNKPRKYTSAIINQENLVPKIAEFKQLKDLYNKNLPDGTPPVQIYNKVRSDKAAAASQSTNKRLVSRGIPQGSPISAVLANVYMIHFDETMHEVAQRLGGLYMRYSDDMIFIVPAQTDADCQAAYAQLSDCFGKFESKVIFNPDKTNALFFSDHAFYKFDVHEHVVDFNQPQKLAYLGFVFNGQDIIVRPGSVFKYYYRMRKKARNLVTQRAKGLHRVPRNLYKTYTDSVSKTHKFKSRKKKDPRSGNFISYLKRVQAVFNLSDPNVTALVSRSKKKLSITIKRLKKKL